MTTDQPTLASALAQLQTSLPKITKNSKAQYGNYANLTDVSEKILPELGKLGLSFTCRPTYVERDDGREFVLAYQLLHAGSGDSLTGEYPLPQGSPQALGSAITYARRYTLCAITGAVAEEDDDGQQAEAEAKKTPRGKPPQRAAGNLPRNRDGQTARSKVTDQELDATGQMTDAQLRDHNRLQRDVQGTGPQGTERLTATPDDDPFYDLPLQPVRTPHAAAPKAGVIQMHMQRILRPEGGQETAEQKTERLGFLGAVIGRKVTSTNDLTAVEGIEAAKFLGGCKNKAALIERLALRAGEPTSP